MNTVIIFLLITFIAGMLVGFRRPADPVVVAIQTDPEDDAQRIGLGCLAAIVAVVAFAITLMVAR